MTTLHTSAPIRLRTVAVLGAVVRVARVVTFLELEARRTHLTARQKRIRHHNEFWAAFTQCVLSCCLLAFLILTYWLRAYMLL